MRRSWLAIGLPSVALLACALGAAWMPSERTCSHHVALCIDQAALRDGAMMAVPAAALLAWGLLAGARQVVRTRRAIHALFGTLRAPSGTLAAVAGALGFADRIDVVDAAVADVFCYGLLRPRVLITSGLVALLDRSELDAVLRHERHHLRRYDPLRVVAWTVLRHACPWLDDDARHAELRRELLADRAAIGARGHRPLASALLKLIEQRQAPPIVDALAVSGLSLTAARIDQLCSDEPPALPRVRLVRMLLLPLVLSATLVLCSLVMSHVRPL